MKLFRFCRQGLTALPVFFALISCDKLLPTSGSGELVPVKIRSVSVKGYGDASATRSAGGEKRIVGQPIVQDLGGGMLAEITVEEEVSALRDGEGTTLANNALYRVVVLDESDSYVAHKTFTMGVEPGVIELEEGTYHFICFSLNTSATLPDAGTGGETGFTLATTTASEIYWQKQSVTFPLEADVSFLLRPQFAKVTLKLDAGTGKTITSIADNSISLDAPTSGSFKLTDGTFVSSSGSINFSGWSNFNEQTVTSGEITFLPKATGDYTLSLDEGAIKLSDDKLSKMSSATLPNSTFEAGKRYTIRVTRGWFAGSNIYWDGEKLTFDLPGTTTHAKYQGVLFKWGSLIGISPAQTTIDGSGSNSFSSGTANDQTSGTPIYMKNKDGNWVKTNVAYATQQNWFGSGAVENKTSTDAWSPIPYYNESMNALETLFSKGNANFGAYKGDICNYINPSYRMPTKAELDALTYSTYITSTSGITVPVGDDNAAGKYILDKNTTVQPQTTYYGVFTSTTGGSHVLPASGYRDSNSGTMDYVGRYGYCWSGSVSSTFSAYDLYFYNSGNSNTSNPFRSSGRTVRCVLQE